MRGLSKKILISLLTTLVVFITVFATTYAWVGIFTYANTDSFKMNLKVQDLDSNYFLTISSSGEPGTFSNEVPTIDIERQLIKKFRNDINLDDASDEFIHKEFSKIGILPATTNLNEDNTFSNFEAINFENNDSLKFKDSQDYYKFDLYLSVDTKEGITESTTGIKANVILADIANTIVGSTCDAWFINGNPFVELPSSEINDILKIIPSHYKIDSKNASRLALQIFDPIDVNNNYLGNELPVDTFIFNGGEDNPLLISNNTYDLGGCLSLEQNTSLQELKILHPGYFDDIDIDLLEEKLTKVQSRNDLQLIEQNSNIWNKYEQESYLGCMNGIQTKMKITIYFWFEGWDADCSRHIVKKPVNINLSFTTGKDD